MVKFYQKIFNTSRNNGEHLLGSLDDHVERLEFYRPDTMLSSASKRLYKVVADLLVSKNEPLRTYSDTALFVSQVGKSIGNDEMMQDGPERALNKLFATMASLLYFQKQYRVRVEGKERNGKQKHGYCSRSAGRLENNRCIDHEYVTFVFDLQQAVLDGLEYLEENKRELPIWGIPPFPNHQIQFHSDHSPPAHIRDVINQEMTLVDESFRKIIGHWRALKDKVDRHLEVLIQIQGPGST